MSRDEEDIPTVQELLLREGIWRSPLVGVALAFTAGIVLDRSLVIPFPWVLVGTTLAIVLALVLRQVGDRRLGLVYLLLAILGLGAARHQLAMLVQEDDIGQLIGPHPVPVRLVAILDDEPRRTSGEDEETFREDNNTAPLRSRPRQASARVLLTVVGVYQGDALQSASGRVRLTISETGKNPSGLLAGLHAGDRILVRGQLVEIKPPANPGEFDASRFWAAQGVRAEIRARGGPESVECLESGWHTSLAGWTGVVRESGHRLVESRLGNEPGPCGLAQALLLGEGAPLTREDWAKYMRTGIIHVLAISGQHLVVLGWFLGSFFSFLGLRQRHVALLVTLVLVSYAVITGARPPALRAAVGACIVCGGILMNRPILQPNLIAAAWLVVLALQPTDAFDQGPQLSFYSVVVLTWCCGPLLRPKQDPLRNLINSSRSPLGRITLIPWRGIKQSYSVCAIVWLAIAPLVCFHTGTIAPVGLLLGPPLGLLTSLALFFGFVLLLVGSWAGAAAQPLAWVVAQLLRICEYLVDLGDALHWHLHVGPLSVIWTAVFCVALLGYFTQPRPWPYRNWLAPGLLAWFSLALLPQVHSQRDELRCDFLHVGHGSCVVLQTPDGRVILYDTGSLSGPEVGTRVISPFLWSQGISRIDDIILSHADLDHYNGLATLLERFPIGRVIISEQFAQKPIRPVSFILKELDRYRVPVVTAHRGDQLGTSNVTMSVLHPPPGFTGSNENARSLVLEITHAGNSILLTGDLEKEGMVAFLQQNPQQADVMQAPHHGSRLLNVRPLLDCVRPKLVVSGQGPDRREARGAKPEPTMYDEWGARYWITHEQGAVQLTSRPGKLLARTFRGNFVQVLKDDSLR